MQPRVQFQEEQEQPASTSKPVNAPSTRDTPRNHAVHGQRAQVPITTQIINGLIRDVQNGNPITIIFMVLVAIFLPTLFSWISGPSIQDVQEIVEIVDAVESIVGTTLP